MSSLQCFFDNNRYEPTFTDHRPIAHTLHQPAVSGTHQLATNGVYDPIVGMDQIDTEMMPSNYTVSAASKNAFKCIRLFYLDPQTHEEILNRRRRQASPSDVIFLHPATHHPDPKEFDSFVGSLPVNRTIHFDCAHPNSGCRQALFHIRKINVGNEPIRIQLNFSVDLAEMSKRILECCSLIGSFVTILIFHF